MVDPSDLDAVIEDLAAAPLKSVVDGTEIVEQPIKDVIAAQQHLAARQVSNPWGSVLQSRVIPPGAVGPGNITPQTEI